jgi:hypothetical protein
MVFMVPMVGRVRLWKLLSHIEMAVLVSIVVVETISISSRVFLCWRRRAKRELKSFIGFAFLVWVVELHSILVMSDRYLKISKI